MKIAYKGFNQDMTCRGFQFKVGKEYVHEGKVKACESGFHSCEYPLDVFNYYEPSSGIFAMVEADGDIDTDSENSKIASGKRKIVASLNLSEMVAAAIKFTFGRSKPEGASSATGNCGASSATGDYGASSATGKSGIAIASGIEGRAMASKGSAIVLCYYDEEGNMIHCKSAIAGKTKGVKPNVWYTLSAEGKFIEVTK